MFINAGSSQNTPVIRRDSSHLQEVSIFTGEFQEQSRLRITFPSFLVLEEKGYLLHIRFPFLLHKNYRQHNWCWNLCFDENASVDRRNSGNFYLDSWNFYILGKWANQRGTFCVFQNIINEKICSSHGFFYEYTKNCNTNFLYFSCLIWKNNYLLIDLFMWLYLRLK